jgi:hypothetical protein
MCLPLNKELFNLVHGKFIESPVFSECDIEEEIKKLRAEYPTYRKVKIKDFKKHIINISHFARVKFPQLKEEIKWNQPMFSACGRLTPL